MCIEDFRLGRKTSREESYPAISATPAQVIIQKTARVSLILSNAGTNDIWIGFSSTVVANAGLRLPVGGSPFTMDIQKYGVMITEGMFAVCAAAQTSVLAIWETSLQDK